MLVYQRVTLNWNSCMYACLLAFSIPFQVLMYFAVKLDRQISRGVDFRACVRVFSLLHSWAKDESVTSCCRFSIVSSLMDLAFSIFA